MAVPHIDTFEHDIAEEIKTKEATITDIASAGGDVSNIPTPHANTSRLLLILGAFFIIAIIAIIAAFFVFTPTDPANNGTATTTDNLPDVSNRLLAISPTLYDAVGGDIGTVSKSEYGYSMQLLSYTNVFAYMIKNEQLFADELSIAVGSPREAGTTTIPYIFSDVTISNQNMRVGTSGSSTVVYAFVNAQALLISSSTEGILTLRSGILAR